jgi:hypothetical protein
MRPHAQRWIVRGVIVMLGIVLALPPLGIVFGPVFAVALMVLSEAQYGRHCWWLGD